MSSRGASSRSPSAPSQLTPDDGTLFERFRQDEGGPTRSHAGLGIGLALARDLVALHGGQIDASSDGKGRGWYSRSDCRSPR
jgi:signal transduction histidine kinase